jgi:ParB-like chromosome segregation protein Spo0J
MTGADAQLQLLPAGPPELRRDSIALELLDGFQDATPSAKLRELIRDLGLLQPIIVAGGGSGRYQVVDGRRRTKAIALLAEDNQWPKPARIEALVVAGHDTGRQEVRGGLALALHASRSSSPASELEAIETILALRGADSEAGTVKQIAAQTGLSVQTVRRRLRLRSLIAELRQAFDDGRIPASVAEAVARLPEPQQQALVRHLCEGSGLTLVHVREQSRQRAGAATAELPEGLFAERPTAWQTTVRGHLIAAVEAIPDEVDLAGLTGLVDEVLAEIERL